jgi:exodeoxyribonuclease V alpha subunit
MQAIERGKEKGKEKRDRGPSSHIITVRFGEGDHSFEIPFNTLAEVGSLMTAYVVTCHKMQGGECPVVVVILHESHRAMLYREWLYTAVTRASEKCIVYSKRTRCERL